MPAVSVIVPVYKVEKYIHRCVDSILSQTFRDFELILVDDGSPDNCPAICDEYAAKDPRVVVIHQKNGGLSAARNAGLDLATGEYIAFVDSDDWLREDALQVLTNHQRKNDADMVLCNIQPTYPPEYTGWQRPASPLKDGVLSREEMVECLSSLHNWYYCVACNKLYKRAIFENLRFPEGYIHEDEAVIHRIVGACQQIAVTSEILYYYRQTTDSITGQGIRIQSTDKLHALADRIVYCAERKWEKLMNASMGGYIDAFLKLFFLFPRNPETEVYFVRMEEDLEKVIPYILKSRSVSFRHKLYLRTIRYNPKIYYSLKRIVKG